MKWGFIHLLFSAVITSINRQSFEQLKLEIKVKEIALNKLLKLVI
jgi:hypothetical protein